MLFPELCRVQIATALLLVTAGTVPVAAQISGDAESGESLVTVSPTASVTEIHPGDRFLLAFRFKIAPQWHIYWANPGETGAATTIKVEAPAGFEVGDILWSRPQNIRAQFVTYGYEDDAILFVPVTAPSMLGSGEATFTATIDWLVCKESCLIGAATETMTIPTNSEPIASDGERTWRFDDSALAHLFETRIPRRIGATSESRFTFDGKRVEITGPAHGLSSVEFFQNCSAGITTIERERTIEGNEFRLILSIEVDAVNVLDERPVAGGVIALGNRLEDPAYFFEIPVDVENRTDGSVDKGK